MLVLALRTDKPDAELALYDSGNQVAQKTWQAHRQLAETLHAKIVELLHLQGSTLQQLEGVIVYEGPGSFTGLRIGLSVANAIAYSLQIPISASGGEGWQQSALKSLGTDSAKFVMPDYGSAVYITPPRK